MPADKTSVAMNAKNTIIAAIKLLLNDRGVRCRNAFVAKTRDNTRFISVIVLLLVGRCQKRAAALSARERSEFIPTWKQALAEWLNFPEAQMRRRDNFGSAVSAGSSLFPGTPKSPALPVSVQARCRRYLISKPHRIAQFLARSQSARKGL